MTCVYHATFPCTFADIVPRPPAERLAVSLKWKLKRIGDKPFTLNDQFIGTFMDDTSATEIQTLAALAKRYTLEGKDKHSICAANAEVGTFL